MFNKFAIITGALAFGAAIATPASAHGGSTYSQSNVSNHDNTSAPNHAAPHATPVRASALWQQIADLERDVNRADARNTISRRESASLHRDISALKQQYRRYNANGISPSEARTLEGSIATARHHLRGDRHDNDRRAY